MTSKLPASSDVVGDRCRQCRVLRGPCRGREQGLGAGAERAPEAESGGNSRFTAGAFRCVYDGVEDLKRLMPDLTDG